MVRRSTVVVVASVLTLSACSGGDPSPDGLPTCRFDVGDEVTRSGGSTYEGSVVPIPGETAYLNADYDDGWLEMSIATSPEGIVTISIRTSQDATPTPDERCRLPE